MPRKITETLTPILLKNVLLNANVKQGEFATKFSTDTGINLSRTSVRYLLDYGHELTRVKNFRQAVTEFCGENYNETLKNMGITEREIWNNITPNKPLNKHTETEDPVTKKLKKLMEAVMITKETMQHFGLKTPPFTLDIRKESEIYLSQNHAIALSVIKEAVEFGGFAVITGQVGSGKTTVLSKFLELNRSKYKYQIIFPEAIDKTKVGAKQILQACVYDLAEVTPKGSIEALSRQVKQLLTKKCNNQERVALIIEEAHDLPTNTLKYLKRLWEMKNGLQRLMGIILVGQNELETRLYGKANTEIREVTARTTHVIVEPIQHELSDYIAHRIRCADGKIDKIITPDALSELSKRMTLQDRNGNTQSIAYPLAINNAMNMLMNTACEQGEVIITKELIINTGI